jgi:hypothetical protein
MLGFNYPHSWLPMASECFGDMLPPTPEIASRARAWGRAAYSCVLQFPAARSGLTSLEICAFRVAGNFPANIDTSATTSVRRAAEEIECFSDDGALAALRIPSRTPAATPRPCSLYKSCCRRLEESGRGIQVILVLVVPEISGLRLTAPPRPSRSRSSREKRPRSPCSTPPHGPENQVPWCTAWCQKHELPESRRPTQALAREHPPR